MSFIRIITFFFLLASFNAVFASTDSEKSREFYLCVKVKKNPVEQCSNKIFGKKDSFRLFIIARAQVQNTKPRVNQQALNYKRLQNLVRSSEDVNN